MNWKRTIAGIMFLLPVLAFGPKEALGYQPPELRPARAALEAAKLRATAAQVGLSSTLSANRNDGNNSYSAALNWQWNFTNRLELALAISRAERNTRQASRDGSKNALLAHAGLWAAQSRVSGGQKRLDAAQARLVVADQKLGLGALSASQREEVVLGVRQAELALRQAQNALQSAQAEAARYGLSGQAEAQVLRFGLKESQAEQNPTYQEALAAALLAQARVDEAGRTLLPQLSFGAGYVGKDTQFQTSLNWQGSGPGASLALGSVPSEIANLPTDPLTGLKPGQGAWKLNLGATLTIAPEAIAGIGQLEAERDRSNIQLQRTLEEVRLRISQTRSDAALALESLSLAQARLDLSKRQLGLIEARAKAGSASPIDLLEAQAGAPEADAAVAQAWQTYITAVGAYLDLSDAEWSVE